MRRVESASQCGACPWVCVPIIRGKQSSGIAATLDIAESREMWLPVRTS